MKRKLALFSKYFIISNCDVLHSHPSAGNSKLHATLVGVIDDFCCGALPREVQGWGVQYVTDMWRLSLMSVRRWRVVG